MSLDRPLIARFVDAALEASIVGSFTTAGYKARAALGEWEDPPSMQGQHVVVTGSSSGIGQATARGLLRLGAEVHITSRSLERADAAATELCAEVPGAVAYAWSLDTGDFASVRSFARDLRAAVPAIDVLIHNAGALTDTYATDDRGVELTLSTHLIGPYLLSALLRDHLVDGARVLWMSSGGMYTQRLDVSKLEMSERSYRGAIAYARAKRAQVELVHHLGPKWAPRVLMHSLHPGWVDTPGVDAGLPGFGKVMGPTLRDADEGADTMIWLASTGGGDEGRNNPGRFWHDRRPRRTNYLPGTGASSGERERLVEWLDAQIAPALAG